MTTETKNPAPRGMQLTPLDPRFKNDPYGVLRELREREPVLQDDKFNRVFLTTFDDVRRVLRDKEMSSDPRKANPKSYFAYIAGTVTSSAQNSDKPSSMLFMDDPDHRRLRGLINKAFTPKAVEAQRPKIRAMARALLDRIDAPQFELIEEFASPLSVSVIAEMLGIAADHHAEFKEWSETTVEAFFSPDRNPEQLAAAGVAQRALNECFRTQIAANRASPRENLISAMIHAEVEGDRMTDAEIVDQCNLILVAGNTTTTDLIGNGVKALLDHPEQLALLRSRPDLISNAVEEILRFDSPVTNAERSAQQPMEIRGCPIHVGDNLTLSLSGANRDPDANPSPDRFDVERERIQHSSFGGGRHLCLGAPLARVECQEALLALLEKFSHLKIAEKGFKYRAVPSFRGLHELWLEAAE